MKHKQILCLVSHLISRIAYFKIQASWKCYGKDKGESHIGEASEVPMRAYWWLSMVLNLTGEGGGSYKGSSWSKPAGITVQSFTPWQRGHSH